MEIKQINSTDFNKPEIEDIRHDVRPWEASNDDQETRIFIDHHLTRAFQSMTLSSHLIVLLIVNVRLSSSTPPSMPVQCKHVGRIGCSPSVTLSLFTIIRLR